MNMYAEKAQQYGFIPMNHDMPMSFPVKVEPLYTKSGNELDSHIRVFRPDTDATLGIHSSGYKVVANDELMSRALSLINQTDLNTDDLQIHTDHSPNGAKFFGQFLFPNESVTIKEGVEVALRVILFNSYDGSLAMRGHAGGFNFVCANTSIVGHHTAQFRLAHRGKDSAVKFLGKVEDMIAAASAFQREHDEMRRWPEITLDDYRVLSFVDAVKDRNAKVGSRLADYWKARWLELRGGDGLQEGPNAWTLYNILTRWSSDAESIGLAAEREEIVVDLVKGREFQELIAA